VHDSCPQSFHERLGVLDPERIRFPANWLTLQEMQTYWRKQTDVREWRAPASGRIQLSPFVTTRTKARAASLALALIAVMS
jgi:hypothetical protein